MNSWDEGYVTEIGYTAGYHRELAPLLMEFALLSRAQDHRVSRPLRYLELGFGQGLSLNIHAAATEGEFWGADFNAAHGAYAQTLADASGAPVRIANDTFEEFAARDDLPEFDVIALHGVWSWISERNRRHVVDIVRRRLALGGVLFISYNCTPGWSPAIPLRHLMWLHAEYATSAGTAMTRRVEQALAFVQSMADANAAYFRANPSVPDRLKRIAGQNRNYLAHEYFNADWHPMPFSEVAAALSEAKLSFAAPAHVLEQIDGINLTAQQQKLLAGFDHVVMRESMRDYFVNQQFRRDLWVRGESRIAGARQMERLRAMRIVLTSAPADIARNLTTPLGRSDLQPAVYDPVIEALAKNGAKPKKVDALIRDLPSLTPGQVAQAIMVLIGAGHASPAQDDAAIKAVRSRTDALNRHIIAHATHGTEVGFLASPVTGCGISVTGIQQLFLRAIAAGKKTPADWAAEAWALLSAQGQRLSRDGKQVESEEDNRAQLGTLAEEFSAKRLPVLRALMVT